MMTRSALNTLHKIALLSFVWLGLFTASITLHASDPLLEEKPVTAPTKLALAHGAYEAIQEKCKQQLAKNRQIRIGKSLKEFLSVGLEEEKPFMEASGYVVRITKSAKTDRKSYKIKDNTQDKIKKSSSYFVCADQSWDFIMSELTHHLEDGGAFTNFHPLLPKARMPEPNFGLLTINFHSPKNALKFSIGWSVTYLEGLSDISKLGVVKLNSKKITQKPAFINPHRIHYTPKGNFYGFTLPLIQRLKQQHISDFVVRFHVLQSTIVPAPTSEETDGSVLQQTMTFENVDLDVTYDAHAEANGSCIDFLPNTEFNFTLDVDLRDPKTKLDLSCKCAQVGCNCGALHHLPIKYALLTRPE